MTNFEKIKAMSVEQMIDIIDSDFGADERLHFCLNKPECLEAFEKDIELPCRNCIREWLEREAQDEAD